jgi:hypothetical protein
MNNAFSRMGRTCASMLFGGALMAGAMFAATPNVITVNLPHSVTVGSATLPAGQYTLTAVEMSDGSDYFVVRGAGAPVVTLQSQKIDSAEKKTQVIFSKDGDNWRFDRLFVEGDTNGYEFTTK